MPRYLRLQLLLLVLLPLGAGSLAADPTAARPIRPGDAQWPVAWVSYTPGPSMEKDFADLKAHGVGLVSTKARSATEAAKLLALCRQTGMKLSIDVPEITQNGELVRKAGLAPEPALMLGGVCQGKALDRHLFSFTAGPQEVVIEPPVYSKVLPYTRGSGGTGVMKKGDPVGHYFPDMPDPVRAEVIVPLKAFDGRQHLKILPAAIDRAPAGTRLECDSAAGLPDCPELRGRKLYRLRFDLGGLAGARLDQVGIAVYWPYHGTKQYWMFGGLAVSAAAPATREALRAATRQALEPWRAANGGRFPGDVVLTARFGDESFFTTGHLNGPAVNYPLWDYSAPAVARFHARAGAIEYPRTWGFPEIYGPAAYGWWLYELHETCAELAGVVREEAARQAPGLLIFRNTTRAGVFDLPNDHDGSGPELLTRQLDLVHLDPYPVSAAGYSTCIPRDMSYYAGLARRYGKPLVPWMQAHTYGYGGASGLQHPTPEQIDRMAAEQERQGVDAVVWLGYGGGCTFPKVNPASWERAAAFHKRLAANPPAKPQARLAVLRGYRAWALTGDCDGKIRNPADWLLQQWLDIWAVKRGLAYDVFEVPPAMSEQERAELGGKLKTYAWIVGTEPWPGAWVIGAKTEGSMVAAGQAKTVRAEFEKEMQRRGWVKD